MKKKREKEPKEVRRIKQSYSNKKVGISLTALAAAAAMFVILVQMEKNVLAEYEKGEVYVAAHSIPKGQMITAENYLDYFIIKEMDKKLIPGTALTTLKQVQDMAAIYDVEQGTHLTEGMFEALRDIWAGMEEPVIAGFRAEDIYQVAGGTLRAGDRIHIYVVKDEIARLAWENIYVQQVFDASGGSISNTDQTMAAQRINIYLDKSDIAAFYSEMADGSLRVVKLCK